MVIIELTPEEVEDLILHYEELVRFGVSTIRLPEEVLKHQRLLAKLKEVVD